MQSTQYYYSLWFHSLSQFPPLHAYPSSSFPFSTHPSQVWLAPLCSSLDFCSASLRVCPPLSLTSALCAAVPLPYPCMPLSRHCSTPHFYAAAHSNFFYMCLFPLQCVREVFALQHWYNAELCAPFIHLVPPIVPSCTKMYCWTACVALFYVYSIVMVS